MENTHVVRKINFRLLEDFQGIYNVEIINIAVLTWFIKRGFNMFYKKWF